MSVIEPDVTDRLLLSRDEAAHVLGVNAKTVDNLRRKGLIKCVRIGRLPKFPRSEVERIARDGAAE